MRVALGFPLWYSTRVSGWRVYIYGGWRYIHMLCSLYLERVLCEEIVLGFQVPNARVGPNLVDDISPLMIYGYGFWMVHYSILCL